jgi:hypothetical protein
MPNMRNALTAAVLTTAFFTGPPARAADVVVNSLSLASWFGGNEGPGGSTGTVSFVPGPDPAPLNGGSAELAVDGTGRASFGTGLYKGTLLATISQLQFKAYVSSFGNPESPSLQFDVDYNATDANTAYQGRLVFIPPTPTLDTWASFDALAGTWWATAMPGQGVCSQGTPCTWGQVLAAFPNASIRNDSIQGGNVLFRLGGPITGGAVVNVDAFTITAGASTTTWDFEPGVSVNPSVAQAGALVTIRAYGFKPQSTVKSFYMVPGTYGKRVLLCSATSSATGAFLCTVPLLTGALAGPPGTHNVVILGQRRVNYTTQIIISP